MIPLKIGFKNLKVIKSVKKLFPLIMNWFFDKNKMMILMRGVKMRRARMGLRIFMERGIMFMIITYERSINLYTKMMRNKKVIKLCKSFSNNNLHYN